MKFNMDSIKEAFIKVKKDINDLANYILELKKEINRINKEIENIKRTILYFQQVYNIKSIQKIENEKFFGNKDYFLSSTGNEGVPTDKQTNRQTINKQTNSKLKRTFQLEEIDKVVLELKKELIEKFKSLTKQELFIFSILYSLIQENESKEKQERKQITYKDIAKYAGLSESSIRDYIARLEKKGIPIIKEKINNKLVVLNLPQELKHFITLEKLMKLL